MPRTHIDPVAPSAQEAAQAASARQAIAAGRSFAVDDLPPVVARVLMEALEATEAGSAVSLVSIESEVTPQQAAAILNVSRPFVVDSLIKTGVLPARMVGAQYRLPLRDVLAYKAENRAKRRETLRQMTELDQELGLI